MSNIFYKTLSPCLPPLNHRINPSSLQKKCLKAKIPSLQTAVSALQLLPKNIGAFYSYIFSMQDKILYFG